MVKFSSSDSISKEFVAKWWSVFDKFEIAKLLDGYVLDRDWTAVIGFAYLVCGWGWVRK